MNGLWWLLLSLGPLLIVQRRLHMELQAVFLLLTHRVDVSLMLVSILFLPGVLLHETSHYLMAHLLGVPTGRISLIPRPQSDGRLQLGFVETARTDIVRDALIGVAPLVTGGICIAFICISQLGLPAMRQSFEGGALAAWIKILANLPTRPDFWLWFYIIFTVSSTMMPSRSDRRAWLPVALVVVLLVGLGLLVGAGPWMWQHLASPINRAAQALAIVFGISLAIHLILLWPLLLSRLLLVCLTGLDVV